MLRPPCGTLIVLPFASAPAVGDRQPLRQRMKRRRVLLLVLLAIVLGACGESPRLSAVVPGAVVLAFGDSVTFGSGAAPGEDWPSRLAAGTGWEVINAGVPGDTAEAARRRLDGLLEEHRPALVIVELGGNDFLRRRPHRAVAADLRWIVERVRQSGAQVVLVAVPELSLLGVISGRASDAALYRELAEAQNVALVSEALSAILSDPELCADRIHPNARGYQRLAAGIHAALAKFGAI